MGKYLQKTCTGTQIFRFFMTIWNRPAGYELHLAPKISPFRALFPSSSSPPPIISAAVSAALCEERLLSFLRAVRPCGTACLRWQHLRAEAPAKYIEKRSHFLQQKAKGKLVDTLLVLHKIGDWKGTPRPPLNPSHPSRHRFSAAKLDHRFKWQLAKMNFAPSTAICKVTFYLLKRLVRRD